MKYMEDSLAFDRDKEHSSNALAFQEIRVLLVEDDPDDVLLIRELIEESLDATVHVELDFAFNYENAINSLKLSRYDICLLDFRIGAKTGLDVLHEIRAASLQMPVVFVTGQGDERTAVNAIKSGADEYVLKKDLKPELLSELFGRYIRQQHKAESLPEEQNYAKLRLGREHLLANMEISMYLDKLIHFLGR